MPNVEEIRVNGETRRVDTDGERSLLSVLRDDLELTGAKYGCGEGQCGACTVLIDGAPTRSCVTPLSAVNGREVATIESLEAEGKLHPVQAAFLEADALQCAYCTSGMILSSVALLRRNADPSEEEIVRALNGNICRCGTYRRIIKAIQLAAKNLNQTTP